MKAKIKLIIISLAMGGFGDLIFNYKLHRYITSNFKGIEVKVVCGKGDKENFKKLSDGMEFILFHEKKNKSVFAGYDKFKFKRDPKYDLMLVCPCPLEYFKNPRNEPKGKNTDKLESHIYNLFNDKSNIDKNRMVFISEYNAPIVKRKNYITTGIPNVNIKNPNSKQPVGIMIDKYKYSKTKENQILKKYDLKKGKYAFVWISDVGGDTEGECLESFLGMIYKKYKNKFSRNNKLDVLLPRLFYVYKEQYEEEYEILNIRYIFPVPHEEIKPIIKFSVKDILVTGDQSLSDVISCCPSKILWYQIASWKKMLSINLSRILGSNYISRSSTSCGSIRSIEFNRDALREIRKNYNFYDYFKGYLNEKIKEIKEEEES